MARGCRLVALVVVAGCGRIAFDPLGWGGGTEGDARDGSLRDGATGDAPMVSGPPTLLIPLDPNDGDRFGTSIALSADGSTLAVGADGEDSNATGVGGDPFNTGASDSGAVYVFVRSGAAWTAPAYIKASNTGALDRFGISVALSGDGSILAVGASGEDSNATGIGGNQSNELAGSSGAVYLFARSGTAWMQTDYVKASNTGTGDFFGASISLSDDGNTLAVGAPYEASGSPGNQGDDGAVGAGAAYVFTRSGTWSQQAYVKASNPEGGDQFALDAAIALSGDGTTLAVGALEEASAARVIDGNQADNNAPGSGAVYVFARAAAWTQQAYIKTGNADGGDHFGERVAIGRDGARLLATAPSEASASASDPADNSAAGAGATYDLARSGSTWSHARYLKAPVVAAGQRFGSAVAVAGSRIAISAPSDAGGAVYVSDDAGSVRIANPRTTTTTFGARYVRFDASGTTLAVGATTDAFAGPACGTVYVFDLSP
jgi:hypothetical protein